MQNEQLTSLIASPDKKPRRIWWIIVAAIIIGVLIGGGVWRWVFKLNNETEIADWQTYRNEEYGFEVKYPNNWRIDNYDSNNLPLTIIPKGQESCDNELGYCSGEIILGIAQNEKRLYIKELLLEQFFSYDDSLYEKSVKEFKKVESDEYDAWEFTYLSPAGFSPENNFWVQLEDGNFLQIIGTVITEEQKDIYRQIISSFRQKIFSSVILEDVSIDYKVTDKRLVKINKDGSRRVVIERLRETLQEDERTLFILYKFDDVTAYILTSFDVRGLDEEGLNQATEVEHSFFKVDLNTGAIIESDNQDGSFGDYKQSEILQ